MPTRRPRSITSRPPGEDAVGNHHAGTLTLDIQAAGTWGVDSCCFLAALSAVLCYNRRNALRRWMRVWLSWLGETVGWEWGWKGNTLQGPGRPLRDRPGPKHPWGLGGEAGAEGCGLQVWPLCRPRGSRGGYDVAGQLPLGAAPRPQLGSQLCGWQQRPELWLGEPTASLMPTLLLPPGDPRESPSSSPPCLPPGGRRGCPG